MVLAIFITNNKLVHGWVSVLWVALLVDQSQINKEPYDLSFVQLGLKSEL